MNITKEKKDDRLVIFVDGKLDTLTSPQLDAELKSAVEESDTVEVNMENLAYMSSAGLRVLHS
ncbi:MAG: STAS domain-containing protein, partial [Ruminococcus sp.]|nr:STAS domain-containing protein [Ruminococcus sp.]